MLGQFGLVEWLAQEGKRSGLEGACPHVFIGITRQENDGNAMTMGDEPILQIKGAQARHMQIGDQARCAADLLIVEKCFGGAKGGSRVTKISSAAKLLNAARRSGAVTSMPSCSIPLGTTQDGGHKPIYKHADRRRWSTVLCSEPAQLRPAGQSRLE